MSHNSRKSLVAKIKKLPSILAQSNVLPNLQKTLASFLALIVFATPSMPLMLTIGAVTMTVIPEKVLAYDGCMDPGYIEYDPGADNDPGGYCNTPIVAGCTDSNYLEYNPSANQDNGSCVTPKVTGCTNTAALNYNSSANQDDGSCVVFGILGFKANANGSFLPGDSIRIKAEFNGQISSGSMVITLDTGASVTLDQINGSYLEGDYIVGVSENSSDLSVSSIDSISVTPTLNPTVYNSTGIGVNLNNNQHVQVGLEDRIIVGDGPYYLTSYKDYLYVANDYGNDISVIDTTTNRVIATIPVASINQSGAFNLYTVGDKVYAIDKISQQLYVINTSSHTLSNTFNIAANSLIAISETKLQNEKAYITYVTNPDIGIIDLTSGSMQIITTAQNIAEISVSNKNLFLLNDLNEIYWTDPAGINPLSHLITLSSYGVDELLEVDNFLYVFGDSTLDIIDIDVNSPNYATIVSTWSLDSLGGIDSTGTSPYIYKNRLFSLRYGSASLAVVDIDPDSLTFNTVIATLPVGLQPQQTLVSHGKIFVINYASNSVSVYDENTLNFIQNISTGPIPFFALVVRDSLYISNLGLSSISTDRASDSVDVISLFSFDSISPKSPHLTSITSTSADANYTVGDNINITASLSMPVGVGSKMRVTLNTGDVVDLTTVSGSELSGTYTVGAGDITSDLTITDISTDTNFTSVVDASGNNAGSSFSIFPSPDLSNDTPRNLGDLKNISVGGGVCSIATGTNPYQMVTVGTYTYAANMGSDNVSVIDTTTNTVIDTISIGDGPYGLTYNSTSKELYIANTFSDNVSVIDLDPANIGTYHTVTHTINVGIQPYYATSLGGMVYVTNNISNTVSVIDTATHAVTATVGVGTAPRGIRAHGTNLYVANYGSGSYGAAPTGNGTVSVINSLTNTVTDTITVGVGPRGVTVLGDEVYVANFESDTVSVINALTNTVTHTITVGDTPRGITASNGNIYVENYQAGTISIIDPLTHTASSEYPVGNTPAGMTTVGTDLYISRFTDNVVSIFDTTNNTLKSSCLADSTSPTFTMQFYSDVGLTTPIADNATLKSGTYYIKITSDEALTGAPTITINAEGTANDVTDATTTLISGNDYSYTYVITSDALAVGGAFANISITGTDTAANTATNADPSNEATKTIYTDTVADASPGTPDMSAGTDTGISSTDNTTNDTTPDFTLSCVTGSTVTLTSSLDGVIGSGACVAGTVTITSSTLSEGVHTNINASQADIAGNVSAVSGDIVVTIDTTVPSAPAITSVDGDVTLPYTTLDTTPDVVVTTSVGDTATITAWTCSPTPAVSTSVTCTPSSALSPGANSVNVILTDSAGNSSSATVLPFTINSPDTTAPTISTVTPITTPTTDTTPDYTFTTNEAGTITYGGSCTSVTTSAIVGNNTITLSTLTPGTYTNCTIRVTDAATNASSILAIPSFVISTSSTGGGGSTPIVTGNQFCTGILPSKAIVIQSGYSGKSHAWRHDSSPTGPYQWCSFRCPNNTLYSSISSSCESISTTPPSITLPPPLPTITPVAPVPRSFLVPTPKRPFWKPWKFPTLNSADDTVSAISQTVSYAGKNNTDFWYPSEDDAIVEKLQKEHPEKNITETDYMNQCVTKESQPYYRKCSIGFDFDTAILFRDDVLCEGFIVKQVSESDYRFTSTAPRKEVTGIAVKMKRIEGKNVALETSSQRAQDTYTDVGHGNDSAEWIAPVVATALKYDIISSERKTFEGDRSVTRAEAYAMIMKSVCMNVTQNTSSDWRKNVHTLAQEQGLTIKSWETFSPERPILRQELFVLASRAGDWAERTGGCDPKPEYCFLK